MVIIYEAWTLLGLGVSVSDTCPYQCLTPTRHLWLYWIMSFFQIIIGVAVSVFVSCLMSVSVSVLHRLLLVDSVKLFYTVSTGTPKIMKYSYWDQYQVRHDTRIVYTDPYQFLFRWFRKMNTGKTYWWLKKVV
jgi:hypothetical protein